VYARPVSQLRRELSAAEFWEAVLALEMGLLPDPWRQAGTVAAAAATAFGGRASPEQYIPRTKSWRRGRAADGRRLLSGADAEAELRRRFGG
jgi:hypothetical protein